MVGGGGGDVKGLGKVTPVGILRIYLGGLTFIGECVRHL